MRMASEAVVAGEYNSTLSTLIACDPGAAVAIAWTPAYLMICDFSSPGHLDNTHTTVTPPPLRPGVVDQSFPYNTPGPSRHRPIPILQSSPTGVGVAQRTG